MSFTKHVVRSDVPEVLTELLYLQCAWGVDAPHGRPRPASGDAEKVIPGSAMISSREWGDHWDVAVTSLSEGSAPGLVPLVSRTESVPADFRRDAFREWHHEVRRRITDKMLHEASTPAFAKLRSLRAIGAPDVEYILPSDDDWFQWVSGSLLLVSESVRFDLGRYAITLEERPPDRRN